MKNPRPASWRLAPRRRLALWTRRARRLDPAVQGLLWTVLAGVLFTLLNALARHLTQQLDPFESQFLRYLAGLLVMLPFLARDGLRAYKPRHVGGQFMRGLVHTLALGMWFVALPHLTLADTTAISFTTPIFIMLGAYVFLREPMHADRWLAALVGFAGVLVVMGPHLSGSGGVFNLLMLASCPMFAASFLITKALTRYETPGVIVVWQALTITVLSLPLALLNWQTPTLWQCAGYLACGVVGSSAHYCLARSYGVTDISATQSVKFLELVWATLLGWVAFSDRPSLSTLLGGVLICAATVWIARRESRRRA